MRQVLRRPDLHCRCSVRRKARRCLIRRAAEIRVAEKFESEKGLLSARCVTELEPSVTRKILIGGGRLNARFEASEVGSPDLGLSRKRQEGGLQ